MVSPSSQIFESYVPEYDALPDKWDDAKIDLVERLKAHANAINIREIGWFLDEELLSGKQFIPSSTLSGESTQYRSIFRKVINCGALVAGVNPPIAHGITVDANFTLMQLYAAATDNVAFTSHPIPNGADTISMTAANIIITVAAPMPICWCVVEYIQEI